MLIRILAIAILLGLPTSAALAQYVGGNWGGIYNLGTAAAPVADNALLLENGSTILVLENGTSSLCLEAGC